MVISYDPRRKTPGVIPKARVFLPWAEGSPLFRDPRLFVILSAARNLVLTLALKLARRSIALLRALCALWFRKLGIN